jgi:predicted nucleic acid-binding protein
MAKNRVFLDSSVLITAVLSSRGGSFYILTQLNDLCEFQTNEYVLEEVQRILGFKFSSKPELKTTLFLILGSASIQVFSNRPIKDLRSFTKIINKEDAPILASAIKYGSYLLTLDNDFFQKRVLYFAHQKGLIILKPREFINLFKRPTA